MAILTLEALEVLDAIDRKGSYAAAALELDKVPSALSYTVQKLEDDLGFRLFRRQGRRSVLTPAGAELVTRGRALLEQTDRLVDHVTQVATGWEPKLTIAADTTVDRSQLWPAINRLFEAHPRAEVSVMEQALGGTWEALFEDRADLIVGAIENVPDQYTRSRQGIRTHPWLPVEMVFVASPQHPICDEPQPLNTETIQQYRGVVVADTASRLGSLTRGTFRQSNLLYMSNMQEKLEAHIASLGIGRVPLFLAQPHIETGRLVALPTTIGRMSEPTTLAYRATHRGRALSYLVEALLKAQLF